MSGKVGAERLSRAQRARWRLAKRETGLARIWRTNIPRSHELWVGDSPEPIATVAPLLNGNRYAVGWYWYGMGKNTAHLRVSSAEEAKAQAMAEYKRQFPAGRAAVKGER